MFFLLKTVSNVRFFFVTLNDVSGKVIYIVGQQSGCMWILFPVKW